MRSSKVLERHENYLVRLDLDLAVGAHRLELSLREGPDNEVLEGDARFVRPLAGEAAFSGSSELDASSETIPKQMMTHRQKIEQRVHRT